MSLLDIYGIAAVAIGVYASAWFSLALMLKRNDIADIAWGMGFILVVIICYSLIPSTRVSIVASSLVILWGVRLSMHIGFRALSSREDFRYAQWRKEWGTAFYWRTFLQVFLLQGAILLIVAAPIFISYTSGTDAFGWISGAGLSIWMVGFLFQSIADAQLSRFKKQKQPGQIMDRGLWKYSRHPNYFGEILMWWGLYLIVGPLPHGWIAIMSPALITYLLACVSGVPMLEKKYVNHPAYQVYKSKTPALVPFSKC
ncbi:MAG: DUF1295 domain-containing protein [Bacteroidota bacterium]